MSRSDRVTGIEVFKSAGTVVIEVQVPSQRVGNTKSWAQISRGIEQNAPQPHLTGTDHQISEAATSLPSTSCGRPRAQETVGNSPVRCEAAPKPKPISIGWSQRVWKLIPAKALNKRDCAFVHISKHFTKILRYEFGMKLQTCQVLSKLRNWDRKKWIDALGRSTDRPRMEYCQNHNGTIRNSLQYKDTVMVPESIQFEFSLTEVQLNWKEPILPHGQLFQLFNQSLRMIYGQEDYV